MDKIQELHHDKVKCLTGIIKTDVLASDHATITEDLMGRFAEWVSSSGWKYEAKFKGWSNERGLFVSTAELIKIFSGGYKIVQS